MIMISFIIFIMLIVFQLSPVSIQNWMEFLFGRKAPYFLVKQWVPVDVP